MSENPSPPAAESADPFLVADRAVAAQRTYTAALRAGRGAGLSPTAAVRAANAYVKRMLGVDWAAELGIESLLDELDGGDRRDGQGSVSGFVVALQAGDLAPLRPAPGLTTTWYEAYVRWCESQGQDVVSIKRFVYELRSQHAVKTQRKRYSIEAGEVGQNSVLYFSVTPPRGRSEADWLGEQLRSSASMFASAGVAKVH